MNSRDLFGTAPNILANTVNSARSTATFCLRLIVGRTAIGRTTIAVLNINDPATVATRAFLIAAHLFP